MTVFFFAGHSQNHKFSHKLSIPPKQICYQPQNYLMIGQLIVAAIEETISDPVEAKFASCSWFDDDEEELDEQSEEEPMVETMRKRLLSQASETTLDTLWTAESNSEHFDEEESVEEGCVFFSDVTQIFEIVSENDVFREELFYTSDEIQRFREEYMQEEIESGSCSL